MVEGLKIDIGWDELSRHLEDRAQYHEDRMRWYEAKVKELGADLGTGQDSLLASNNPVPSFDQSAKSHRDLGAYFRFLATHVIQNETYRLSDVDLTRLEILSKYYR